MLPSPPGWISIYCLENLELDVESHLQLKKLTSPAHTKIFLNLVPYKNLVHSSFLSITFPFYPREWMGQLSVKALPQWKWT